MDTISDFIIRLKNAGEAHKDSFEVSHTKLNLAVATVLEKEGFIKSITKKGKRDPKSLEIEVIYDGKTPKVQGVKRISKLSKRVYQKSSEIRPIRQGYGIAILSTPKGLLSNKDAKKEKVGGEVLFQIW